MLNIASVQAVTTHLAKNKLLLDCYQFMQADELILPTIPDVSCKIRQAMNDSDASSHKIARVVQTDPAITARLIQIANSPLYCGRKKIESCPEALTRLGLRAAQDIVTSFAIKSVFHAQTALIRQKMSALWAHSSHIAAICAVLAHKLSGFDPDRAMLAGLVHDIGIVPILTHADRNPDIIAHPKDLADTVKSLRVEIGQQIIRKWEFPGDFEDVIAHAENWYRNTPESSSYADIVMIAQLHSFIGRIDSKKMPRFADLPVYQKMARHLKVDDSLNILESANEEIEQIRQMLN